MAENKVLQDEEMEVLKSIYDENFEIVDNAESAFRTVRVRIEGPHEIMVTIDLPSTYPSSVMPIARISDSFGLTDRQCSEILHDLTVIFEKSSGQVCLYEWIENIREKYEHGEVEIEKKNAHENNAHKQEDFQLTENSSVTLRPRVRVPHLHRDHAREARLVPLIYHGEPLTDRKSTFQAHVCPVSSLEDVQSFLAILLDDRKIERALHNMLAYRINCGYILKDNDEDGENNAGSIMSHLLEMMHVENISVVVTRWYGGIKLGPDRFKHITNVVRTALLESGYHRNLK